MKLPLVDRLDQHAYDRILAAIEWWESPEADHKQPEWIKEKLLNMLCPTGEQLHDIENLNALIHDIENLNAECPCCGETKDTWGDDDYAAFGGLLKMAKWTVERDANKKYQERVQP